MHEDHQCNSHYCKVCEQTVANDSFHQCFVPVWTKPKKPSSATPIGDVTKIITFDFETTQSRVMGPNKMAHDPIFVVAHVACDKCCDRWTRVEEDYCQWCNEKAEVKFSGENTLKLFCRWLFSDAHARSVAFAHNGKAFDHNFLLQYLIQEGCEPTVIDQGLSIMCIEASDMRVLCSRNFFACSLAKLPALFDLECVKGYFPFKRLVSAQ